MLKRLLGALALARLTPFDTSTETGRAAERYRRAALTSLATAGAAVGSVMVNFVTVPLTVGYLGQERYGLWMTISSTVLMINFLDLGMGNGLMNAISKVTGKRDDHSSAIFVSSAFFQLLAVAALALAVFAVVYPKVSWADAFRVSSPLAREETGPALAVVLACFCISLPLSVAQRTQMGYQEGFTSRLIQMASSLLALAGLLLAVLLQAGLPWLALALAAPPTISLLANWLVEFHWRRPWLAPKWSRFRWSAARYIVVTGLSFFAIQILSTINSASDNLIIAQTLGPEAVTQYAVPFKLFMVVTLVPSLMINPLWTAYGEAFSRGDLKWIERTLAHSLRINGLITVVVAVFLVVFGTTLIYYWAGPTIEASIGLLLAVAVMTIMTSVSYPYTVFLLGVNALTFSVLTSLLFTPTVLLAKYILVQEYGIPAIAWSHAAVFGLVVAAPTLLYVPRFLKSAQGASQSTSR